MGSKHLKYIGVKFNCQVSDTKSLQRKANCTADPAESAYHDVAPHPFRFFSFLSATQTFVLVSANPGQCSRRVANQSRI